MITDPSLPAIALPLQGPDSRERLWEKAKLTLQYVYDNFIDEYEWFFKADDDTYVVMENLRDYISTVDPTLPWFLGRPFKFPALNVSSYLTGGPGLF